MGSADRPHKKITHSPSTSNDDPVQVSHFSPKLPANQSNSEERPSKGLFPSYLIVFIISGFCISIVKNLTEGVKNVKFYSTIVGGRAPFFAIQQVRYHCLLNQHNSICHSGIILHF